jgi:hypothetical protein
LKVLKCAGKRWRDQLDRFHKKAVLQTAKEKEISTHDKKKEGHLDWSHLA